MKIFCILSSLTQGGAEKVMVDALKRWVVDHEVYLLTIYGEEKDFFQVPASVKRYSLDIGTRKIWHLKSQVRIVMGIKRAVQEADPDYVVSFVLKTNIYTSMALSYTRYKMVLCEHSIIDHPDIPVLLKKLRGFYYPKAYRVGVLTEDSLKELLHLYPKILGDSVVVLPNPIEIVKMTPPAEITAFREKWKVSEESVLLLGVGRLVPLKNFSQLIRLSGLVRREGTKVRTLIFGDGPERQSLQNLVEEEKLTDVVVLPGRIKNVFLAIQAADIVISTSTMEGFPMNVLEAMAAQKPIVAFRAPGVSHLIKDKENGLLIDMGDLESMKNAVIKIVEEPALSKQLGASARRTAEMYTGNNIDEIWFKQVFLR